MRHLSPAVRWWAMPVVIAAVAVAAAVANFATGEWVTGALLVVFGVTSVLGRHTQRLAYRAGYWRGCYEETTQTRPPGVFDGWQPEPWHPLPPPPWLSTEGRPGPRPSA